MSIRRSIVYWVATLWLCACAVDGVTPAPEVEGDSGELVAINYCSDARSCPVSAIACIPCPDGSYSCPEAQCIDGRCRQQFPKCPPIDKCAAVRCRAGTHCVDGACIPDERVFCGGIAAFPCPGSGRCIDDPTDSCDPQHGGADCGGLCVCNISALCIAGTHWDPSPKVCACVPDEPTKVFCGGIAGIRCPGAGTCVDDPDDTCDPTQGDADCGGMCICKSIGLCKPGTHWDPSPNVCGCVPGVQCGKRTCGADQICCSPSCGICGTRGGLCPAIACIEPPVLQ